MINRDNSLPIMFTNAKGKVVPHRPLYEIARIIRNDWGKKVNYAAKPYLEAMSALELIKDNYIQDSAASVISYFLANAGTWRGDTAKAVKLELKEILKLA